MRHPRLIATILVVAAVIIGAPTSLLAQQPPPAPTPTPPKPYKMVAVKLSTPISDPTFDAFRKQLAEVASRKDRGALGPLVGKTFFWMQGSDDLADKGKPGIDSLIEALGLDGPEAEGWHSLAAAASDPAAAPHGKHRNAVCAPVLPSFDEQAFEALTEATETDVSEWAYPVNDGIEVRSAARPNAPVAEKLGLYMVRLYPDDSPAAAVLNAGFMRLVLPSGNFGYVEVASLAPVSSDQLCYAKEGGVWKIAGVIGSSP